MKSTHTVKGRWFSILTVGALTFGLLTLTSGCGPVQQTATPVAAPSNVPPGGGSTDDYNKKMMEIQGKGGGPGMPGGGAPPPATGPSGTPVPATAGR